MDDQSDYRVPATRRSYVVTAAMIGCLFGIVSCFASYFFLVWYQDQHLPVDPDFTDVIGVNLEAYLRIGGGFLLSVVISIILATKIIRAIHRSNMHISQLHKALAMIVLISIIALMYILRSKSDYINWIIAGVWLFIHGLFCSTRGRVFD